tara:strand:+ start:634 stop:2487 length:1854 start_codon:yes stop_codon:yes gene_type:complete
MDNYPKGKVPKMNYVKESSSVEEKQNIQDENKTKATAEESKANALSAEVVPPKNIESMVESEANSLTNEIESSSPLVNKEIKESSSQLPPKDENNAETKASISMERQALLKEIEAKDKVEEKLTLAISFLRDALAQPVTPHFKEFWEIKKLCIELFKGELAAPLRTSLWNEYIEICSEARRLKEILDEQAQFAIEQIDIAISALENEVANLEKLNKSQPSVKLKIESKYLKDKWPEYESLQKQLNLLNALASRINSLRKELIKTEMRIRNKNKFFQRLSTTGDSVFPDRKRLIKEVSDRFLKDVETFVKKSFSSDQLDGPIFYFREEIKALQSLAKVLTLNTQSFTTTRAHLSKSWDKIKNFEKEHKKDRARKKNEFKENYTQLRDELLTIKKEFEENKTSLEQASNQVHQLSTKARATQLGRDEVQKFRKELGELRQELKSKQKEEEQLLIQQKKEVEKKRQEKIHSLKSKIENLVRCAPNMALEEIEGQKQEVLQEVESSSLQNYEKQSLERSLKPLKDIVADIREQKLLKLPENDKEALEQYQTLLKERLERRKDIKAQIESYRKACGTSGLDFEKAMSYNQLMNEEKERLKKNNEGIEEIEQKIKSLKEKIEP